MAILTGQTVYEQILSLDVDGNPVTGATFDTVMYKDGVADTGITISMMLSDSARGIFTASWSASTYGDYQLYAKNNSTSVVFVSDTVLIQSGGTGVANVYIGL